MRKATASDLPTSPVIPDIEMRGQRRVTQPAGSWKWGQCGHQRTIWVQHCAWMIVTVEIVCNDTRSVAIGVVQSPPLFIDFRPCQGPMYNGWLQAQNYDLHRESLTNVPSLKHVSKWVKNQLDSHVVVLQRNLWPPKNVKCWEGILSVLHWWYFLAQELWRS